MNHRWVCLFALFTASSLATADDLLSVYNTAKQSDPEFQAAAAQRHAAFESKAQSRAGFLPQVELSAHTTQSDYEISGQSSDSNSQGYTLQVNQSLYNHETYTLNRQADAILNQADATYQAAEQTLILRTAQAYFEALAAIENLNFAKSEKEAIARQLEQTKQRFEVGMIAITDVHESQAAYDTALAAEITAESRLDIAMVGLQEITGTAITDINPLGNNLQLEPPAPADIKKWVDQALGNNLQLQATEQAVEIARQVMEGAKGGHYPSLSLVGRHSYTDEQVFGSSTIEDSTTTSLSVQLSVPIYSGGATSSQVRQSRYQLDESRQRYEQQRRAVERSTRTAYLDVIAGISRVQALQQALKSSESALEASEAGLEVGTRTTVDVLNSRREMFRAKSNLAQAKYQYILNTLRLKDAAGNLNMDDLHKINGWLDQN